MRRLEVENNPINLDRMLRFAKMGSLALVDPNDASSSRTTNSFRQYSREDILGYLKDPRRNSENLIDASIYLYSTDLIYRRICTYFATMPTYDYVLVPLKMKDYEESAADSYRKSYTKSIALVENMNLRQLAQNMTKTIVREGAYYAIEVSTNDSYMHLQIPHKYCKVSTWEDGCPLLTMDMSFFDRQQTLLESIGGTIKSAFEAYKKDNKKKWVTIDSNTGVCILGDETIDYIVPLLAGLFSDIYLLEDYKDLVKSKEVIELYKLISLKLPLDEDGKLLMPESMAIKYYNQMANQLPEQIGLALNPFTLNEVSFKQSSADRDATARAERDLWSTAGVSTLLFNNEKASSTALVESMMNDYSFILPIVRSIERWINKKLKMLSGSTKFKLVFPDVNIYTRTKFAENLRKDMQYGLPVRTMLTAVDTGYTPSDVMGMLFMENEVMKLNERMIPPVSSNTISVSSDEGGRPTKNEDELSESGEQTRESDGNEGRADV